MLEKNQKSSVLFGDSLWQTIPQIRTDRPVCVLEGTDYSGVNAFIPFDESVTTTF